MVVASSNCSSQSKGRESWNMDPEREGKKKKKEGRWGWIRGWWKAGGKNQEDEKEGGVVVAQAQMALQVGVVVVEASHGGGEVAAKWKVVEDGVVGEAGSESSKVVLEGELGRAHNSTVFQATLNCLSLLYGLGILSSPYAVAEAGLAGAGVSMAVAATYAWAAWLMGRCVEREPGECGSYQAIARKALGEKKAGKAMQRVITALFYVEITGTLLGYCIAIADNLHRVFPDGLGGGSGAMAGLSARDLLLCLAALVILPTVWLRDLSALSFTSLWCIASSLILLAAVLFAATTDGVGFHNPPPLIRARALPVAAGLYAFSYGGTSVFPSVYSSMRRPAKFAWALTISFAVATASIVGLGIVGAYMFGPQTKSQVTLSMPVHLISTKIVLWSTIITPMFKFALQLSPITTALENHLRRRCNTSKPLMFAITTLMRSSVLAAIVVTSMIFPYFQYIVALVGSSMTIAICMIFPCLFYLKLFWHELKLPSIVIILVLVVFGTVVAACGTVVSMQGLIASKRNHAS